MVFGFGGREERPQEDLALAHEKQLLGDLQESELKKNRPKFSKRFKKGSDKVGFSVGQFERVATRPQPVFSEEQEALSQMFGGGDKMWGLGDESDTKVTIHHDLNPRQRGDFGTAEMFGF